MPAIQIKLKCEVNVSTDLIDSQVAVNKVRLLVESAKLQTLSPEALEVLTSASNLDVETKWLGRAAKQGVALA
jgi:hypothetical protein